STSASLLAPWIAELGRPSSSSTISLIGRPRTPPALLISSTASFTEFSDSWQETAADPVRPNRIPIFTGSAPPRGSSIAANAAPASRPVAFNRGSVLVDILHLPAVIVVQPHFARLYKLYLILWSRSDRCQRRPPGDHEAARRWPR